MRKTLSGFRFYDCGCIVRPYQVDTVSIAPGDRDWHNDVAFNRTLKDRFTPCAKHKARLNIPLLYGKIETDMECLDRLNIPLI